MLPCNPSKLSVDILLMSLLMSLHATSILHRMGYRASSSGVLHSSICMNRLNVFLSTLLTLTVDAKLVYLATLLELAELDKEVPVRSKRAPMAALVVEYPSHMERKKSDAYTANI